MKEGERLYLRQLEIGPMQNFVYLMGDWQTRECAVVDPAWDVEAILRQAREDGMTVRYALVTHSHYDHVNGLPELLEKTDAQAFIHEKEIEFFKIPKGSIKAVSGGDTLDIGQVRIRFIHTPGHTPGSQCFHVENRLVSGDTLFINACGRCDLLGGDAEEMYRSLTQRLLKLDDATILLPGHNYDERPSSTMGDERRSNPYLKSTRLEDFLNLRMG